MRRLLLILLFSIGVVHAQTTVTLDGQSYQLNSHPRVLLDGASGPLTTSLSQTCSNCKANSNNQLYTRLQSNTLGWINTYTDTPTLANIYGRANYQSFGPCASAALYWQATGGASGGNANALTLAKWCIDHVEGTWSASTGCDVSVVNCNRPPDSDFTSFALPLIAQTYSIIRGQLTPTEISTFAAKILNDNTILNNGIDLNACVPVLLTKSGSGATLSASTTSTTVTGTGTHFTNYHAGDTLLDAAGNFIGIIAVTPTSDTQLTLDTDSLQPETNQQFYYSPAWTPTTCGIVWFLKNIQATPILGSPAATYSLSYPGSNAGGFAYPGYNLIFTKLQGFIAIALALADDDPRAATLLTQAYNYYVGNPADPLQKVNSGDYEYALSAWTGFTQSGGAYTQERMGWFAPEIAIMIKNSLVNGPDLLGTNYLEREMPYFYYLALPASGSGMAIPNWGQAYASIFAPTDEELRVVPLDLYLFSSAPEAPFLNYFLQHRSDWNIVGATQLGSYLLYWYPFWDPGLSSSNTDTLSTSYVFKDTDYSACQALPTPPGGTAPTCYNNSGIQAWISKSDWTATATELFAQSGFFSNGYDHLSNGGGLQNPVGAYHIYRNGFLLAGDGLGCGTGFDQGYVAPNAIADNFITLGPVNAVSWINTGFSVTPGLASQITRWAGTDPTGVSSNDYAYARTDMTAIYQPSFNPTLVARDVIHFKKPSTQDYLVEYGDAETSSGKQKTAFYHYWLQNGANTVTTGGASGIVAGTVRNTTPSSMLLSSYLSVSGATDSIVLTDDGNSYAGNSSTVGGGCGGNANTHRINVCASSNGSSCDASALKGEWIAVHEPISGTSGSMPTISEPLVSATGGSAVAVDIQDGSSPKVAVFARNGSTLSSLAFTSTHAGTAQYVISGLAPGAYFANGNGTVVNPSGSVVSAGDNTMYFESASGPITVSQGDFTVGVTPSSQVITQQGGQLSTSFTVNLAALGNFSGPVTLTLAVNGQPGCLATGTTPAPPTCSFTSIGSLSSGSPQTATLNITVATDTLPGSYPLTITATGGSSPVLSVSSNVTLFVGGDFSLALTSPSSQTALPTSNNLANNASYGFNLGAIGTFAGTVSFSAAASSGPALGAANITVSTSPVSVPANGSNTGAVTLIAAANTPAGSYPVTITANGISSGLNINHTANVTFVVNDFSVSSTTSGQAQRIPRGGSTTFNVTVNPLAQYVGQVDLSVAITGSPAGVSAGFTSSSVNVTPATAAAAILNVTTTAAAAASTFTISVTATDHATGALSHSITYTLNVDDYSLSATTSSQSVPAGSTANFTLTGSPINGFNDTLTLQNVTNLPAGATPSLGSGIAVLGAAANGTLAITTSATTPAGVYSLVVTTQDSTGLLRHTASLTLTVTSFSVSSGTGTQTIVPGQSASYSITASALQGFNGTVTLSTGALPPGVTVSAGLGSIALGTPVTVTLASAATTPAANYNVTIIGTSGNFQATATVTLDVQAFTLSSPASQTVTPGATATYSIAAAAQNGFAGSIALTSASSPAGLSVSLVSSTTPGTPVSVQVVTTASTALGNYSVTITGTSGTYRTTATLALTVAAATQAGFALSAAVASGNTGTIAPGGSVAYVITVTSNNGFSGGVGLSAPGAPSGVQITFLPSSTVTAPGTAILILSTSGSVSTGTINVGLTGTSGSSMATSSLALNVVSATSVAPSAVLGAQASASTQTIQAGQAATISVAVLANEPNLTGVTITCDPNTTAGGTCSTATPTPQSGSTSFDTATFTYTSSATAQLHMPGHGRRSSGPMLALWGTGASGFAAVVLAAAAPRRRKTRFWKLLLLLSLAGFTACAGAGGGVGGNFSSSGGSGGATALAVNLKVQATGTVGGHTVTIPEATVTINVQ